MASSFATIEIRFDWSGGVGRFLIEQAPEGLADALAAAVDRFLEENREADDARGVEQLAAQLDVYLKRRHRYGLPGGEGCAPPPACSCALSMVPADVLHALQGLKHEPRCGRHVATDAGVFAGHRCPDCGTNLTFIGGREYSCEAAELHQAPHRFFSFRRFMRWELRRPVEQGGAVVLAIDEEGQGG